MFYGFSTGVTGLPRIYILSLTFFLFFPRGQADDQPIDLLDGGGKWRVASTSCGAPNNNTDERVPTPEKSCSCREPTLKKGPTPTCRVQVGATFHDWNDGFPRTAVPGYLRLGTYTTSLGRVIRQ